MAGAAGEGLLAGNLAYVLVAGALALAAVGLLLRRSGGKGALPTPPVLHGVPVVGGVLKFIAGPMKLMREGYDRYGEVFSVFVLHKRITFLIGPSVSPHFFKAPDMELSQKEVYGYSVPTFGPGVVFDVDHVVRGEQIRFFSDALRTGRLYSYVGMMVTEAQAFFSKWADEGEVDLKDELSHLIILTASRCLLGREVRENMFEQVSALFHDLDLGMLPISVLAPYLPIPAHRRRDRARAELGRLFKKVIQARRASGVSEPDILQAYIDARYKDGRATNEEEITGLLIATLFAGQHTSAITSTWTGLLLLAAGDKYLPAIVEEQRRVMRDHGDVLDYDVLSKMDCLHRAVKEVVRLYPPLIMLLRYTHNPFNVTTAEGRSYSIPAGTIVATSPAFAHRLPHVYTNPDAYDPDRFTEGREEDKKAGAFAYIGFGGGRHGCMGENFAYMQIKTIWSVILRNFELELVSPLPEPDYESMVVGPKPPCVIRYKRRKLQPLSR
eukprot:jgi/Chlat1/2140/Chrsp17S02727